MRKRRGVGPDTVPRRGAVVIVDQDGFTRSMLDEGAEIALRRIWTIRRLLVPLFRSAGGEVYKVDADNLYAFFENTDAALQASLNAHRTLAAESSRSGQALRVCIGIGYGDLLYVTSEDDYYGAEVNLASKLGEDIADGGETLLTAAACRSLQSPPGERGRKRRSRVSKVLVRFFEWGDR